MTNNYSVPEDEKLLTAAQVSEWLQLTRRTLDAQRRRGIGPKYVHIGRTVRYRVGDIHDYIKEGKDAGDRGESTGDGSAVA